MGVSHDNCTLWHESCRMTDTRFFLHFYKYFHLIGCDGQKPSWRSWLARQSHNLKVVSSSLTEGILFYVIFELNCFGSKEICLNFGIWLHLKSKSVF